MTSSAQGWRFSAARVEIARLRSAVFHSSPVSGRSIRAKTASTIASSSASLFGK